MLFVFHSCWICWNSTPVSKSTIKPAIRWRTATWCSSIMTASRHSRRQPLSNTLNWGGLRWPMWPASIRAKLYRSILKASGMNFSFKFSIRVNVICFGNFSTTVLQDVAAYLKLLPPPDNSDNDEKDKEFLMELLVTVAVCVIHVKVKLIRWFFITDFPSRKTRFTTGGVEWNAVVPDRGHHLEREHRADGILFRRRMSRLAQAQFAVPYATRLPVAELQPVSTRVDLWNSTRHRGLGLPHETLEGRRRWCSVWRMGSNGSAHHSFLRRRGWKTKHWRETTFTRSSWRFRHPWCPKWCQVRVGKFAQTWCMLPDYRSAAWSAWNPFQLQVYFAILFF